MDLQYKLLEAIIQTYLRKGIPLVKALDNPLFQKLPLEYKQSLLEKYKDESKDPTIVSTPLLKGMGSGALKGAIAMGSLGGAVSIAQNTLKLNPSMAPKILAAAGAGALLGAVLPLPGVLQNYKRDKETHKLLKDNQILEAIALRSMKGPAPIYSEPLFNLGPQDIIASRNKILNKINAMDFGQQSTPPQSSTNLMY